MRNNRAALATLEYCTVDRGGSLALISTTRQGETQLLPNPNGPKKGIGSFEDAAVACELSLNRLLGR